VRSSQDAVIAKTADGVVTAWNGGATALYGWSAEQMVGSNIEATFPPESVAEERTRHTQVASGTSESGYRCTRLRADGGRVDVVMSMSPVRDGADRIIGVASVSRRVSAAERDEARYASLLEAAPDATVCAGPDGRIVTVNAQVCALFGYTRDELIGAELEVLLPEGLRERHVGHRMAFASDPRTRTMGSGLSLLARRRDGSTFPVEVSLAPDLSGGDGLVIAAVRDVSEQRSLEEVSRESESRLRQLAESVDIVFLLLQLDPLKYLYMSPNAERILGLVVADEFATTGGSHVIHPDDREVLRRDFHLPSRAGLAASAEHRVIGADGVIRWLRTVASPVPNPNGPPQRTVITTMDITGQVAAAEALRTAETAARTANDAKNQFLSRMSHELRTPLNAILGFAQLLQRQRADTDQAEAVGHILKGGRHLLDMINDVLDIARIEAGEMALSLEPVSVADVVDETVQLMAPLATDAHVTLNVAGGPDGTYVRADRQRLRQIMLNLVSNAIKYNHPGGGVWVAWEHLERQATVSVRDDGRGISADLQSRLFTPFDRLGAEGSGVDGTGIGLSLTRSLAEVMGGTVNVESVPGRGSTFKVVLPSGEPIGPDVASDRAARVESPTLSPPSLATVLYIEDNEPNVQVIEHVVRLRPEWRLIHAALGQLGIELAQAHRPDLVLLDLHLPDLSGRDVLLRLKSQPTTAATPIAILTADANSSLPRQLRDAGADHFLTKPLDIDDVLALLDDVAARKDNRG
jgi:PAS domain S-box-containing protein